MEEKSVKTQNRKIKVGNTTIVIKRTFGALNLCEVYSDYVAKAMKERIKTQSSAVPASA